ncbi:Lysophospholipase, alpha-beta hydrolase superfamily [Mariniphaga anaerophila]|uniref:Lysophospholipase, alpha-beta hydrolase superfamily n=2 Tax=Mariniphaga anaerophila TaxID=1484053 RepID=A0A1M4T8R1_9BACT|nr:Lysophospholipase, alpha-beta hydrolase superfamily [Mariniphaga anaerophila]
MVKLFHEQLSLNITGEMRKTLIFALLMAHSIVGFTQELPDNFSEFTIRSASDNLPISVLTAGTATPPKAVVQLVHGMCEHKERYIAFMQYLTEKGYACVIHDHRGHGESVLFENDLGYFYSGGYRAMVEDVKMVTDYMKKQYPGLKLFLFGHSMGSMVVRSYTKLFDDEIDGLIVCGSPSYSAGSKFGKGIAKRIAKRKGEHFRSAKLQKLSFGSFNKKFPEATSPNAWVCSDKQIVEKYDADSKCNFVFTANGFRNLYELMGDAYSKNNWKTGQPDLPIWFISGQEDPCLISLSKFNKAVKRMRTVGYRNVDAKLYPNMRHEILNEIGKEEVWNDIATKLDSWR